MKRKAKRTTNFFHLVPVGKMIFQPPQKKKTNFMQSIWSKTLDSTFVWSKRCLSLKKGSLRWNHTFKKKTARICREKLFNKFSMATNFSELSHHLSLAEGDGMLGMAPLGVSSILLLIGVKSPRPKRLGSQSRRTAQRWRNSTVFSPKKNKKQVSPFGAKKSSHDL